MTAQTRAAAFCARAAIVKAQQSAFIANPTPAQWAAIDSRAAAAAAQAATPSQAGATKTAQAKVPSAASSGPSTNGFIANPTPAQWAIIDARLAAKDAACPPVQTKSTSPAGSSSPARAQKGQQAAKRPHRPHRPRKPRARRAR